ncbi:MAG: hypothetical protein Q8R38_01010 [Candidatus Omnitrophota bacterium]|nr:hypothetical protein [Candidatus Omnitrophota bacterium]
MSNTAIRLIITAALILATSIFTRPAFSQEETEYKKFKLEDASCDVGVRYKNTPQGLIVGICAIATGKGAEFRKWSVSEIKIRVGDKRLRPDKDGKSYVTEESLFRVPGAVIFAAIGAFGEYGGSNFNNNFSKVGMALGLGLIALQAKGEITGERCVFYIPKEVAEKIEEGKDNIEIVVENEGLHIKENIKIGLVIPTGDTVKKYNFDNMNEDELSNRMDIIRSEIVSLEERQSSYKYGQDPQYDAIQKKIEGLETERGLAYNAWFEKRHGRD